MGSLGHFHPLLSFLPLPDCYFLHCIGGYHGSVWKCFCRGFLPCPKVSRTICAQSFRYDGFMGFSPWITTLALCQFCTGTKTSVGGLACNCIVNPALGGVYSPGRQAWVAAIHALRSVCWGAFGWITWPGATIDLFCSHLNGVFYWVI